LVIGGDDQTGVLGNILHAFVFQSPKEFAKKVDKRAQRTNQPLWQRRLAMPVACNQMFSR
jgi:hypothetical protein